VLADHAVPHTTDIAVDGAGRVVIASGGATVPVPNPVSHAVYRSVHRLELASGVLTPVAGSDRQSGSEDGAGLQARFGDPLGVAVGADGSILVADAGNHAVRRIDASGRVTTLAGGAGAGRTNGPRLQARFSTPTRLAAAGDGGFYVADAANPAVRKVSASGDVSTLVLLDAATGAPLPLTGARLSDFHEVIDVARRPQGGVYVLLRRYGSSGGGTVHACDASLRCAAVQGAAAYGIASDVNGVLYYTTPNEVVVVQPDGSARTVVTGLGLASGIRVDAGRIHVADFGFSRINTYDTAGTLLRTVGGAGLGYVDGPANVAQLERPSALAVGGGGNIYFTDNSMTVRRIDPDGVVSTIAGTAGNAATRLGAGPGVLGLVRGIEWIGGVLYASVANGIVAIAPAP
jgi:streptogramin lyase